ncbi:MAG: alpha-amylase, partial [Hymenobacteraceae bacterium]|nr:alpha-amylase [Hymenobacteraceae bacterium]MDX5396060.1 alpha-amylase [Hymenobacteraceae bacterium]MDX5512123.1 alpha-amylase [Hymenobacteraceae bacterium]
KMMNKLPEHVRPEAEEVLSLRNEIMDSFKQIFAHKINTLKIRTHGDYHLGQVLFTGKDFVILDFEGEPARSYSERRLKRSPLRDVAGMIRSFHYAAYNVLQQDDHKQQEPEQQEKLQEWAEKWYQYISGFYIKSYLDVVGNAPILPDNKRDFDVLMHTFLLEKAVYEMGYELNNRPNWVQIPIRGILSIMKTYLHGTEENK